MEIAIEELRKNAGTLDSDRIKQRDDISERIDDLDQRMTKLYLAYENGDIEHEFFAKRNRRVLAHSDELKTFLRDETPGRAKAWLRTFLKRYWVEPGWVTYEYRLPLPPGSPNAGLKRHKVPLDEDFRSTTRLGPAGRGARSQLGRRRLYLRYPEHAVSWCHRCIHGNVQGGGSNRRFRTPCCGARRIRCPRLHRQNSGPN